MELIRGPKPLTEIERAFAAEAYRLLKPELFLTRARPVLTPEQRKERRRQYMRAWYWRRKAKQSA